MSSAAFPRFTALGQDGPALTGSAADTLLGTARLGPRSGGDEAAWPLQTIPAPVLGGDAGLRHEGWHGAAPCRGGRFQDIRYRRSGDILFGVIELDEVAAPRDGIAPLQQAAEFAYRQIFTLLQGEGLPHLWRVWNYVPDINRVEHGLERYRQFNIGRHQAFAAFERPVDSSPAACALGVASGPLSIAFLAGGTATTRIENPRQVSAFAYPAAYGPRSPTFTRAALLDRAGGQLLLISGTASIVGHETVHLGDVVAQTRESMANIEALLAEAARAGGVFAPDELLYRVYIRHAADYPAVRDALEARLPGIRAVYVQADVCRDDLLVEIEALCCRAAA